MRATTLETIIATTPAGGVYLVRGDSYGHYAHGTACVSASERGYRAPDGTEAWWPAEHYIDAKAIAVIDPKGQREHAKAEKRARESVGTRAALMGIATPRAGLYVVDTMAGA